jgi:hypothetical protein
LRVGTTEAIVGGSGAGQTAPVNTAVPTVSGSATQGSTLTSTTGSWTGNPAPTYAYQWLRCDSSGASCVTISGATNSSYTLLAADVGSTIRCRVTGTNAQGSVQAQSAATAVVGSSSGSVLFNGGIAAGTLSGWNHDFSGGSTIVSTPFGNMMRSQTSASVSMVNVGQDFAAYQLP